MCGVLIERYQVAWRFEEARLSFNITTKRDRPTHLKIFQILESRTEQK